MSGIVSLLRSAAPAPAVPAPPVDERPYALSLIRAVEQGLSSAAKRAHNARAARIAAGLPPTREDEISERRRSYFREWYARNAESKRAYQRARYARDGERIRAAQNARRLAERLVRRPSAAVHGTKPRAAAHGLATGHGPREGGGRSGHGRSG